MKNCDFPSTILLTLYTKKYEETSNFDKKDPLNTNTTDSGRQIVFIHTQLRPSLTLFHWSFTVVCFAYDFRFLLEFSARKNGKTFSHNQTFVFDFIDN